MTMTDLIPANMYKANDMPRSSDSTPAGPRRKDTSIAMRQAAPR